MTTTKTETASKKDVQKLQRAIVDGLEDVKAMDIQVFNTEHLSPLFERVIVASGASNRQTKALASSVRDAVREAGFPKPRIEGEDNGEWIIVDCGAAVAHIMQPAIRQYYHLEEIWGDTPVRLKLGAAKPAKPAPEVAEKAVAGPARKPGRTAASKTATADTAAGRKALGASKKPAARKAPERPLAPPAPVLPSEKRPARKTAAKTAPVPSTPAKKVAAKKVAAVPSKAPMQKLIVPAPGPKAPAKKAAAKAAPAKKVAAKKTAVRKPAAPR